MRDLLQKISNMDPNTKRYSEFVNAYKNVYPDLKKAVQLEKTQKLWSYIKNHSTKFEETLVDLQLRTREKESKQLSFWSNLKSKPIKAPTNQLENFVDTPQSSSQNENQSAIE